MSGPVAGAPVVHGPPAADSTPAPQPERPRSSPSPSTGSKATPPSQANAAGSASSASAPPPVAPSEEALPGGLDAGTVARISGLKAAQELNGLLCQILRPADSAPDRVVVRTCKGEKSLKLANLLLGVRGVFPAWVGVAAVVLLVLSSLASLDVLLGTRSPFSAAAVPLLAMVWMVGTVSLLFWAYRPCRAPDVWVPSVSELGLYSPLSRAYRFGFLQLAVLFAVTIWLYSELLVPKLAPPPAVGTPWHASAALLVDTELGHSADGQEEGSEEEVASGEEASTQDGESNEDETARESEESNADPAAGDADPSEASNASSRPNVTNVTGNMTAFLTWAPNRSVAWGYGAAVGAALQGLVTFDGRFSVRSTVHLAGMGAFVVGAMQHAAQSTMVLLSSRGRPLAVLSSHVRTSLRLRQNITSYGPLVLLGVPLGSQLMQMNKPAMQAQRMKSAVNILKESGLLKLVGLLQWALIVIYALFYSTFCVDFWFASQAD